MMVFVVLLMGILSLSETNALVSSTRREVLQQLGSTSAFLTAGATLFGIASTPAVADDTAVEAKPKFRRYPQIRFIAALGDPKASSGTGAETWGLWKDDPGPRGVYLRDYERQLAQNNLQAPAGWTFDPSDWWLEEHGLIMSKPADKLDRKRFDKSTNSVLPFKRYVVTGAREVTTVLTLYDDGKWELEKGTLYDVTHLPCRSARYRPESEGSCSPTSANRKDFPVTPGAIMPSVSGCSKQDYAVLFVLGEEA